MKQSGDLSLEELYQIADELCLKWWNVRFEGAICLVKNKWKRMNAYFVPVRNEDNQTFIGAITFSSIKNAQRTREEVISTLLHELVHWRMWKTGKPYEDYSPDFVKECWRVGAPFSKTKTAQRAMRLYKT